MRPGAMLMKNVPQYLVGVCLAGLGLAGGSQSEGKAAATKATPVATAADDPAALKEADALLAAQARQTGVSLADMMKTHAPGRFTRQQNVFLPGALAVDFQRKTITLPLYKGIGPSGTPTYYILTDAADFAVAQKLGVNYSPKLANGRGTEGVQLATLENGLLRFAGDVDFKPERAVKPGPLPNTFPPAMAQPGSLADDKYSPLVVLPSGSVVNASIVANGTGQHDHAVSIDYAKGTVVFELLDGFQRGEQYYYHIVTESSDMGAATIERGTFTPRLGKLPAFGKDELSDKSALLGFAPLANGATGANNPERQGLNSTILDGPTFAPINVFPIDPDNAKREGNNYSPMWDAHIYAWTPQAIEAGKRRRVKSLEQLTQLVKDGSVMNVPANMGEPNAYIAGLKPTHAIINCSVMAQPAKALAE